MSRILDFFSRWQVPLETPPIPLPSQALPFTLRIAIVFKGILLVRIGLEGAASLLNSYTPYFLKLVIDSLTGESVNGSIPPTTYHHLIVYIVVSLVTAMVLSHVSRLLYIIGLQTSIFTLLRRWLYARQLEQTLSVFHATFAGSLANQIKEAAQATYSIISHISGSFIWSPLAIGVGFYLFWNAHPLLIVPMLAWSALYLTLQYTQIRHLDKLSAEAARLRSRVAGYIVDTFSNILTVKLFSNLDAERRNVTRELHAEQRNELALQWGYFKLDISGSLLQNALDGFTLVTAVWLYYQNAITLGDIVMAMGLVQILRNNVRFLSSEISDMVDAKGQLQQALNELLQPIVLQDKPSALPLNATPGDLIFKNVSFRYTSAGPFIFENLHLHIPAGQKVGLVGVSGAGKSTLVNVLLRFYDVEGGAVLVNGQDIRDVTQHSLRQHLGMVTQDSALLHRSIAENIAYGKPDASHDDIVEAARKAHAHDFITTLSDPEGRCGYDAHVGERGVRLSGGQRQRIAIARLILKNAPVLILDEATSALDSETEAAIQENLSQLMHGKTVIAIAHRLSTVIQMDRLIVMDQGKIVEDGSHSELLARNGLYAQLWRRQTNGFLPNDTLATPQNPAKSAG